MAVFTTTAQLLTLLKQEVNDVAPSSDTNTRMLQLLNSCYQEILKGGGMLNENREGRQRTAPVDFPWLPRTKEVVVLEKRVEVDITGTLGSASVTLSAAPTSSIVDYRIIINGVIYTVSAHTGGSTSAILDSTLISESGTYSGYYWKSLYTLSSSAVLRLLDKPVLQGQKETKLDVLAWEDINDNNISIGTPSALAYTVLSSGALVLKLDKIPDALYRLDLSFLLGQADLDLVGSDPIFPPTDRKILAHFAAFYQLTKRDDTRAQSQLRMAISLWEQMRNGLRSERASKGNRWFARVLPLRVR